MFSFVANNINNVINGDTAKEAIIGVNDGCLNKVVFFKPVSDFTFISNGIDRFNLMGHDFTDGERTTAADEFGQFEGTDVMILMIDNIKTIGVFGDITKNSEVA